MKQVFQTHLDFHTLLKVKIGLPATHRSTSNEVLIWRVTRSDLARFVFGSTVLVGSHQRN